MRIVMWRPGSRLLAPQPMRGSFRVAHEKLKEKVPLLKTHQNSNSQEYFVMPSVFFVLFLLVWVETFKADVGLKPPRHNFPATSIHYQFRLEHGVSLRVFTPTVERETIMGQTNKKKNWPVIGCDSRIFMSFLCEFGHDHDIAPRVCPPTLERQKWWGRTKTKLTPNPMWPQYFPITS